MIILLDFHPSEAIIIFNMRVIVLLCLLPAAFGQQAVTYNWGGLPSEPVDLCLIDQSACGCCVMKSQMERMKKYFDHACVEMDELLTKTKTILNNKRASRSAYSVALNNDPRISCFGPFITDRVIVYKHVFINLGLGYNIQDGIFTVPRSGVYSLSVSIYNPSGNTKACANLLVNDQVVSVLPEQNGQDSEDSATIVTTLKLFAKDKVSVKLIKGCTLCDDTNHHNTFTGFLLYATD